MSKCPACKGFSFRLTESSPSSSKFKLMLVECSACGTVVGAMDFYNIGQLLKEQNKALKTIAQAVGAHVNLTT